MKLLFFLVLSFLYAAVIHAAPTFDAASGQGTCTGLTSVSWTHTTGGGCTDCAVYAGIIINVTDGADPSSSATYGGNAMVKLDSIGLATEEVLVVFRRLAPATGANTIEISWTGAFNCTAASVTYSGVHQTTAEGTIAKQGDGSGTTITTNVSSNSGETVVDFLATRFSTDNTMAATESGQTERIEQNRSVANTLHVAVSDRAGETTTAMSWSWTTDANAYHIGIPVKPAATAAVRRRLTVFGVGP